MKIFSLTNRILIPRNPEEFAKCLVISNPLTASRETALELLESLDVSAYARSRNDLDGAVSKLSVYLEHGLLNVADFLEHIRNTDSAPHAEPLLKQLFWREFFLQTYESERSKIWEDYELYKTGYTPSEYADILPADISAGTTKVPIIDILIKELELTGYLHNHGRLYLASYIVHFRKVKWQAGAQWMLKRLNDGNIAINNLSWQWVASTRSDKPYIYNWENLEKFAARKYHLKREDHLIFDASYEEIASRLFKKKISNV